MTATEGQHHNSHLVACALREHHACIPAQESYGCSGMDLRRIGEYPRNHQYASASYGDDDGIQMAGSRQDRMFNGQHLYTNTSVQGFRAGGRPSS